MSGAPFTIYDSSIDADRNGELVDPVPAGGLQRHGNPDAMQNVDNKGGRNGAIGPDYFQIDMRAGWRRKISANRSDRGLPATSTTSPTARTSTIR